VRAFVTGATGFVGSHLVDALRGGGHEVVCLARDPAKAQRLFGQPGPRLVRGDLSDTEALARGAADADVVFHVAGLIAARTAAEFYAVNRDATARVVAAVRRAAPRLTRFVYVSSLAAAGPSRRGTAVRETDPPHPVSHYGRSKLAGEEAVRAGGVPWTIVRPPTVYGPRDRETLRLFRFARHGVMPLYGDPRQELSFVHAADLASALLAATAPACAGGVYFATHPEIATSRQAMELIVAAARSAAGRRPAKPVFLPIPHLVTVAALWVLGTAARLRGHATLLSPDKGLELLAEGWTCTAAALERDGGWRASRDLATGLGDTARWYVTNGWL
jgi:nucleoside-diphosphate-sugar epimerase